jgi:protein SCO1/2
MTIFKIRESSKTPALQAALLAAALLCLPLPALADHCHGEHDAETAESAAVPAESVAETAEPTAAPADTQALGSIHIPDVELFDQDGNKIHFYSDLVEGRTVAMNFIFTTCTTICPPLGANFAKLQKLLGEDAGRVQMISVSVDPVVDTPQRLKAWADKFGRAPGLGPPRWTLVTGPKPEIDKLLKSLQAFTPDKDDHAPIVLLGNAADGRWTRTYGLTAPAQLAEMVEQLAAGTRVAAAAHTHQEGR